MYLSDRGLNGSPVHEGLFYFALSLVLAIAKRGSPKSIKNMETKIMKKKYVLWIVLALVWISVSFNVEAKQQDEFTKIVLPNGLTLMYRVMKNQPMVSMCAAVSIGMNHPKRSIAHLTEHMIFRGNSQYSFADILDVTSRLGGTFDGETSFYATFFNYGVPKSGFDEAFKVFNSTIWSAGLAESNMALEQKIIVHEAEMNYASRLEMYPVLHYFYPENNDTVTTVNAITHQDLKEYYQSFYQPANITYIIAGDFQPEGVISALKQVKNIYGESAQKISDVTIKGFDLPHHDVVEERNIYPYQFQMLLAYEFEGLSPEERMILRVLSYLYGETNRVDYEKNELRDYYVAMRSVGEKDFFGLYYLERDRPYNQQIYNEEKANLLKFIRQFKKVDIKKQLKMVTFAVELEQARSNNSAPEAVDYELQRLIDPENITIDSLNILKRLNDKDLQRVIDKCFSQPPAINILVKNAVQGGN
jgi:predicted Zn-dependent peptidase